MEREEQEKIFTRKVRAGKRTYFFDVKTTKSQEYYLSISESRRIQKDGEFAYEKSKIFVYKEDLEKVLEALQESVDYIKHTLLPEVDFSKFKEESYNRDAQKPIEDSVEKPSKDVDEDLDFNLKWE
jgi:hypothetical protein